MDENSQEEDQVINCALVGTLLYEKINVVLILIFAPWVRIVD